MIRRDWITYNAALSLAPMSARRNTLYRTGNTPTTGNGRAIHSAAHDVAWTTQDASLDAWEVLVRRAVTAARRAGAHYADARITHTISQQYSFAERGPNCAETVGLGVRALYNGYWGFAATPGGDGGEAERLAEAAVAQARVNARGMPRTVGLGTVAPAVGRWAMPITIDPFVIPIEEKLAHIQYWLDYSTQVGHAIERLSSSLYCERTECVVATSDGAHFAQTTYESGGTVSVQEIRMTKGGLQMVQLPVERLAPAGKGWELFLEADIPGQLRGMGARFDALLSAQAGAKPAQVGRYTLVCDGATTAALLDRTLGIATQLDRALGYEANASGTSFLDEPLEMLGSFQVASPLVTVTANRSIPGGLATVKWDDEGVEPDQFTLVNDGVLVDYQTTREQAGWLAPYYQKVGKPIRSHGCAAVDSALTIPMQHAPNLGMLPAAGGGTLDGLLASVENGILIRNGQVESDFQARTGMVYGEMYEIRGGKLGRMLTGGAVIYDTLGLWKHITGVGGAATVAAVGVSAFPYPAEYWKMLGRYPVKGEPPQFPSHTVQAPAITVTGQAVVDPRRKA